MKTYLLLFVLVLTSVLRADPPEADKYTLDELEAMGDRAEWGELVFHLEDVIPAQRNTKWKALVERASDRYVRQLLDGGQVADTVADSLRERFAFLAKSRAFSRRRADAKLKALELCYGGKVADAECRGRATDFARENRKDGEWLRRAAESVTRLSRAAEAVPFYRLLIENDRKGAGWCREAPVRRALLAGLAAKAEEDRQPSRELALGLCWHALRAEIRKAAGEPGGEWHAVACEIARAKKQPAPRCPASH